METEDVPALARFWTERVPCPHPPSDHWFPVEALAFVGSRLFGGWNGTEMQVAELIPTLLQPPELVFRGAEPREPEIEELLPAYLDALEFARRAGFGADISSHETFSWDDWQEARRAANDAFFRRARCKIVRKKSISFLVEALSNGRLRSKWRTQGGGEAQDIPAQWWALDDPLARFRTCGLDPENPWNTSIASTAWFFVNADDLRILIDRALRPGDRSTNNGQPAAVNAPARVSMRAIADYVELANREGWSQLKLIKSAASHFPEGSPSRAALIRMDCEIREAMRLPPRARGAPRKEGRNSPK